MVIKERCMGGGWGEVRRMTRREGQGRHGQGEVWRRRAVTRYWDGAGERSDRGTVGRGTRKR